tara:strand:- start:2453 stop:2686 length:234 start_codon:yes stop_codon:yes gene_type:complete
MSSDHIVAKIEELLDDELISKNVKTKLENIKGLLSDDDCVNTNRALSELEDVNEDPNMPSFIREEIMNVTSMLSQLR